MKCLTRSDELLMKLAEGQILEEEDKELFGLINKDSVEGYLSVIELEDELSNIDSSVPVDFVSQVMSSISDRAVQRRELRGAFLSSFQNTFIGLMALIFVIGPSQVFNTVSGRFIESGNIQLANTFKTQSIVSNEVPSVGTQKNDLAVLIELVDGATKQKEFVSGVLRVNSKSPEKASLLLPKYEASVLKEFERRVAL